MDDWQKLPFKRFTNMDYGSMVGESFEYAKEAVVGKWNKWLMLIIATILLGIPLMGYAMKVLRGEKPAPEVNDWGTLFIDGIKYLIVSLIYALPIIIVWVLVMGASAAAIMSGNYSAMMAAFGAVALGVLVMFILAVIISVFEVIGIVRFARTGSIGEAFNISAILATINKIGWVPYILALIVLIIVAIIIAIIAGILMMIPYLGIIIYICLIAPIALLYTRYICLLYDNAGAV
jgi:hypothetical protein